MKRTLWSAAAALILAAVVTIPVIAQPPQGGGGTDGPGGRGPGRRGGPFPMLRALNLSEAQREQIRSITEQQRGQADSPQRKVAELQKQLQLAILADSPDPQKIEELKSAVAAATAEALSARLEVESRIAQVLTPEQRAQAREALAKVGPPNRPLNGGRRGRR